MKTLIANIKYAARNKETISIGGGDFDARELLFLADSIETLADVSRCLSWHEQKHGVGMDKKAVEQAFDILAKAQRD